jgi:hypothetical protein
MVTCSQIHVYDVEQLGLYECVDGHTKSTVCDTQQQCIQ